MADDDGTAIKVCNTCKLSKSILEYHKNKSSKGGRLPRCKHCRAIVDAPYVEAHREIIRKRAREWAKANPAKSAVRVKEWVARHPERIKEIARKHRMSPQGRAAAVLQMANRDPQKRREVVLRYYERNPDRYRNYRRNRRARIAGAEGSHTKEDVARIIALQGMRCVYCKVKLANNRYHVDHQMPLALGGSNDKTNLQVLCPRCNRSKGAKHPLQFARERGLLL